jgi:hypothetical protein
MKLKIKNHKIDNSVDLSTIQTKSNPDLSNYNNNIKNLKNQFPKSRDFFNTNTISRDLYSNLMTLKKHASSKYYLKTTIENKAKDENSILMKKLENWDKDNLHITKENPQELYIKLKNLYKKINMKKEIKRLKQLNSLLTQKSNFNKLMENGQKSNKILEDFFNRRNKDQGSILKNNIIKTNTRYSYSLFDSRNQKDIEENIGVDSKTLNAMNSKDINDQYYTRVIKDKIKYEKQLHSELIDLNNNIQDKKEEKNITTQKLSDIYNKQSKLTKNFNKLYNERKSLLERFQDDYEKKGKIHKSTFIKTFEVSKKNEELKNNIKEAKKDYVNNMKIIDSEKENCLKDMKRIENEMCYFKQINNELIKEQRQYYMEILRNGYDSRNEGMIWVVRNLLELNTNLEYHHFPKFLTHEQIDYLIKISSISLDEIQLKIILKVLKQKQKDLRIKENIRRMTVVDNIYADIKRKSIQNNDNDILELTKKTHKRVLTEYEKETIKIRNEINKKFMKLYYKNEETIRMFAEKNIDDNKDEILIEKLRECLFGRTNYHTTNSLLKLFEGDQRQKKILNVILYIRQKLHELNSIKKKIKDEQILIFKESQKYDESELDVKQLMQKELVKKCLFGVSANF